MSFLTLGWEVNKTQEPRYWLQGTPAPGEQSESDLVRIPSKLMASHTAIVAQSGAGKSFFIGRLVEEILLNTRARCLVIDPNGDFRRVNEVASDLLWEKATYASVTKSGKLPHEAFRGQFLRDWNEVTILIRTGDRLELSGFKQTSPAHNKQAIKVSWTALDVDFLAEDLGPLFRSNLFHCHQFVSALEGLLAVKDLALLREGKLLEEAEKLMRLSRQLPKDTFREMVVTTFPSERARALSAPSQASSAWQFFWSLFAGPPQFRKDVIRAWKEQLVSSAAYISEEVERYYFAKAREYQGKEIMETSLPPLQDSTSEPPRLTVIDLPSLRDKSTRLLATNAILTDEWNAAIASWTRAMKGLPEEDQRVPTFIVLDEAHNFIPATPPGRREEALRDQFRMIVAEGRKYGLFLVLASQRPDKVDPMVFSECDNVAMMRINSEPIVKLTAQMLGLDALSQQLSQKCLEFETGRALLTGQWVPEGPKILYAAARRTIEGGRNLNPDNWAIPRERAPLDETKKAESTGISIAASRAAAARPGKTVKPSASSSSRRRKAKKPLKA